MNWDSRYRLAASQTNQGEMSLEITGSVGVDMFCSLPDGTEIYVITVAPFGLGVSAEGLLMCAQLREEAQEWCRNEGTDQLPHSLIVYRLPDGYTVPDSPEQAADKYQEGVRDGRAGNMMKSFTAMGLNGWDDPEYSQYRDGYKRGNQMRGGKR